MTDRKKKRTKSVPRAGRKKAPNKWLSLDSLMGKSLCVLLVIILTVGAFLAPKMVNNLYDAGTLMQITYADMDLSTYAVAYASFQEKIMAIARANTAGEKLVALQAEDSEEKIGDEELIGIVNQEIDNMESGFGKIFHESWWSELTEENLISRRKVAAYAQAQRNGQDNASGQEMAPIQFWILSFEITEKQKQKYVRYEDLYDTEKKGAIEEVISTSNVTDRLIVCLDAEFFKIYAMAVEGDTEEIMSWYGMDISRLFMMQEYMEVAYKEAMATGAVPDANLELGMIFTDQNIADWAAYWDVEPADKHIYLSIPGETSGCMAFSDEKEETGQVEEEPDQGKEAGYADTDGAPLNSAGAGEVIGEAYDVEYMGYGMYFVDSASDITYGSESGEGENEILLEVGLSGYDESGAWIQKSGCREFFEMMQF